MIFRIASDMFELRRADGFEGVKECEVREKE